MQTLRCDDLDDVSHCLCLLTPGHETPHVCGCGCGWMDLPDGRLLIYEWAGGPDPLRDDESAVERAVLYAKRKPIAERTRSGMQ